MYNFLAIYCKHVKTVKKHNLELNSLSYYPYHGIKYAENNNIKFKHKVLRQKDDKRFLKHFHQYE